MNDYSHDKVTSLCDGAHFWNNPPSPACAKTCLCACSQLDLHVNARKNIDVSTQGCVCPRMCVFANVSHPLPLIIAGHIHVWHLPLTSAPRQAQLLKGQTPQWVSITSMLSSSSSPSFFTASFLHIGLTGAANLTWKEEKKWG